MSDDYKLQLSVKQDALGLMWNVRANTIDEFDEFLKQIKNKYGVDLLPQVAATPPSVSVPETKMTAPSEPPVSTPPTTQMIPAVTLSVSVTDGRKYFRIRGGQFAKWGIVVYPEVLAAAGIATDKLEAKEYSLEGKALNAFYSLKPDGKTAKVVRLAKSE